MNDICATWLIGIARSVASLPVAVGFSSAAALLIPLLLLAGTLTGPYAEQIGSIIEAIRQLMVPPEKSRREIGFHVREKATRKYGVRKRN